MNADRRKERSKQHGGTDIEWNLHRSERSDYRNTDSGVETMNIGKNIKFMRIKAGLQQVELAEKVGVSQSMICQIERGTKTCSIPLGMDIAEAIGCRIEDLLNDDQSA